MLNFTTPLSALRANAVALDVVAHNIANANTEGYARQVVHFAERRSIPQYGHLIGQGVDIADIRSTLDLNVERAINRNASDAEAISTRLKYASEIEVLLAPGPGSLSNRLEDFFNQLEGLTAHPDDSGARNVVVQSAEALAQEINTVADQLDEMLLRIDQQIQSSLANANKLSEQLVTVNNELSDAEARGDTASDLINTRNKLLTELSVELDVELTHLGGKASDSSFRLANGQLVFDSSPLKLFSTVIGDEAVILRQGAIGTVSIESGKIGGLLHARNTMVRDFVSQIEEFATSFVSAVDGAHSAGVGESGGFTALIGDRRLSDPELSLGSNDTIGTVTDGRLYIAITDDSNGTRSLHEVRVDPSQTLEELAAAISNVENVQAVANSRTGQLSILAEPGFRFDFTGGVPTFPTTESISGTTEARLSGIYEGEQNENLSFHFIGDGTVGVTENLVLEVRDEAGLFLGSFQVGRGYEPGSEINLGDGLSLTLETGTVADGDSFSAFAISKADESGVLVALGINTLFSGKDASSLRIRDEILDDSSLLAMSKSGQLLETKNIQSMIRLRDDVLMNEESQTFEVFLANAVAEVGAEVSGLTLFGDRLEIIGQSLDSERQSLIGVDENEEIVRMLQYQRAFQSAARFVSAIDETLQELFNILR